jgi:hypothetical protein
MIMIVVTAVETSNLTNFILLAIANILQIIAISVIITIILIIITIFYSGKLLITTILIVVYDSICILFLKTYILTAVI